MTRKEFLNKLEHQYGYNKTVAESLYSDLVMHNIYKIKDLIVILNDCGVSGLNKIWANSFMNR